MYVLRITCPRERSPAIPAQRRRRPSSEERHAKDSDLVRLQVWPSIRPSIAEADRDAGAGDYGHDHGRSAAGAARDSTIFAADDNDAAGRASAAALSGQG